MSRLKTYLFWILAVIIVAFGAVRIFGLISFNNTSAINNSVTVATSSAPAISPMQSTGQLFSGTSRRSYLIFPTLASGASQALDGFTMTTDNLGNNLYRIMLTPKASDYRTQTFVLTGDDKLYFFETSFGDDNPIQDYVYNDDYAVAVDSQGYVLQ